MRMVILGDIVGRPGRRAVLDGLRHVRRSTGADLVLANAENATDGVGLNARHARRLLDGGLDVLTSGNHIFRRPDIAPVLDHSDRLLRPANYPPGAPGRGCGVYRPPNLPPFAVINALGRTYMEPLDCPFRTVDALLEGLPEDVSIVVVDFHAEATSEKKALGFYLDGRISALCGTHTHVQTNDAQILPGGTAYITDLGMCGPQRSSLGMEPDPVIRRYLTGLYQRFAVARTEPSLQGAVLDVDDDTGKALQITAWRWAPHDERFRAETPEGGA